MLGSLPNKCVPLRLENKIWRPGISVAPQCFIYNGMLWHIIKKLQILRSGYCTCPFCDFNIFRLTVHPQFYSQYLCFVFVCLTVLVFPKYAHYKKDV